MDVTAENWMGYATICRLCMRKDGFMMAIFNRFREKGKSLQKKIMDFTDIQISSGDGLPRCICHRCLFKIEFCMEFKQQCSVADAALRQINIDSSRHPETVNMDSLQDSLQDENVVMVVDPLALDYDSDCDSDRENEQSDTENVEFGDLYRNVFMCKFCDHAYTNKNECISHENSNHNHNIPYHCADCDMCFADRAQYSAHLKSIHQNDKPYNCPQCERTFARRSDLRKHTVVHTGIKPFTCPVCRKSFSRNTNLSKHMRIHSGTKPFVCPKCPKTFTSKGDLTRHAIIHSGQKPYRCNYCHLSFGRRDKLQRHEKRHFPQNAEDKSQELEMMRQNLAMNDYGYDTGKNQKKDGGNANRENQKQDEWTSSENMIINLDPFNHNSYGNTESTSQSDLQIKSEPAEPETEDAIPSDPEHIVEEAENASQVLKDETSIKKSPKKTKPVIKRYQCLRCNKRFTNQESLRLHMNLHTNDKPYNCFMCHKTFLRKRELDRHLASHTGIKPYKCTSCDKRFGRKDKLVRHIRIHEINRDHVCVICGAAFNRKDGLLQHMKTHHLKEYTETMATSNVE